MRKPPETPEELATNSNKTYKEFLRPYYAPITLSFLTLIGLTLGTQLNCRLISTVDCEIQNESGSRIGESTCVTTAPLSGGGYGATFFWVGCLFSVPLLIALGIRFTKSVIRKKEDLPDLYVRRPMSHTGTPISLSTYAYPALVYMTTNNLLGARYFYETRPTDD